MPVGNDDLEKSSTVKARLRDVGTPLSRLQPVRVLLQSMALRTSRTEGK